MRIIRTDLLPIGRRFSAINICGVIFARRGARISPELINHEAIHSRQMRELLVVPFYVAYVLEWLVRLMLRGGDTYAAYRDISFEREAYRHEGDEGYLPARPLFAQWRGKG